MARAGTLRHRQTASEIIGIVGDRVARGPWCARRDLIQQVLRPGSFYLGDEQGADALSTLARLLAISAR